MATDACKTSKVKINEVNIKPATMVAVDDLVQVRKNGFNLEFKVVKLISKRVSATLAQPCYEDLTPESEINKYKDWYIGKASAEKRLRGEGRPTKKDRRHLEDFKNEYLEDFDFED